MMIEISIDKLVFILILILINWTEGISDRMKLKKTIRSNKSLVDNNQTIETKRNLINKWISKEWRTKKRKEEKGIRKGIRIG